MQKQVSQVSKIMQASLIPLLALSAVFAFPMVALGGEGGENIIPSMVDNPWSIAALVVFFISYTAVFFEEKTHLKKSKPVILGAGLIWVFIAIVAPSYGIEKHQVHKAVHYGLEEYSSMLLFLLAAMTYIATLQERKVFDALRVRLVMAGLNMRQLFWVTGICAFCLSPVADNLTTALVMGAVVMAVGGHDKNFIVLSCINIVSAANAGGAFSPFGDITTLMVWQAGHVEFFEFFNLFLPSLVCFLVPAFIMSFFVSKDKPEALREEVKMRRGAKVIIFLGFLTIAMAVVFEQFLGLPAFMGMMTGMGLLMITAWIIRKTGKHENENLDILDLVANSEWDTLLFFFGVIFSVSGLAFLGYLELVSTTLYEGHNPSVANIAIGFASAVIDNIPIMFAVLTMNPEMDHFQWLLVTLTCGVGGTMLSIGSAAGVALMGVARGRYTFFSHLKWTPVICLGYASGIAVHFWVNTGLMGVMK